MPTATGSWAPNSSTNRRMRLRVIYDVPTPSAGQSSVTVTGTVYLDAGYSFYHNGATFVHSGSLLGSATYSKNVNVPTNGSQAIHTFSQSVALTSSAQSKSLQLSVTGISYVGSGTKASLNTTVSIPARVAVIPPRSMGIARVSNTRLRLSWTGGDAHDIQVRRSTVRGAGSGSMTAWETAGTVGQVRSSPAELNVIAGYRWQARARRLVNGVWSDWSGLSGLVNLFDPAPQASNVVATSQSDSRQVLTWTVAATNDRPIVDQVIQRWSYTQGTYVTVATVAGTARSWVDTVGFANNRGRYRVLPRNAEGNSGWAYSNFFYTTPAAPTILSVSRTGPTTVAITWQINARQITSQSVQQQTSSDGGVTWSSWSNITGHTDFGTTITSRTITGLNAALQYRFRVTANSHNDAPNPNRFGYSTPSDIIRPAARPNAPAMLAPSGTVSTMEPVQARWRHNPADGSAQTAYELRYRLLGGSWTTLSGTSTATDTSELPITDPGTYEVQVRTKGQHADYSDWSSPAVFEALNPPGVTIVEPEPGGVVESNRASVFATFEDETGSSATSWRAELVYDGEVIENRSGLGWSVFGDRIWFNTELENFTEYTIRLWITSGTGLESAPAEVTFTTDFLPPTPPTLSASWEEEAGLVRLGIENYPAGDGTVDTDHNRIERSTDLGQTWTIVADNLPVEAGFDDDTVPLSTIVWYRAVAVSSWMTEAYSNVVEVRTDSDKLWLTGLLNGVKLMLECDLKLDVNFAQERVSEEYYGRTWPYSHYGEHRGVQVTVGASWTIKGIPCSEGMGTTNDPYELYGQDLLYRDPMGRAFRAGLTSDIQIQQENHWVQTVGFTVERVQV